MNYKSFLDKPFRLMSIVGFVYLVIMLLLNLLTDFSYELSIMPYSRIVSYSAEGLALLFCILTFCFYNKHFFYYIALEILVFSNLYTGRIYTALFITSIMFILMLLESMLRLLNVNCTITQKDTVQKQDEALPVKVRDERISRREQEIVQLLCKGYTNKQIARQLFISETTVKTHISNILAKLNLHDRMQIVVYYYNKINGTTTSDADNNEEAD